MNKLFLSEHNGKIEVRKFLWETSVWAGGFQQSGPLVKDVWKKALGVIPANAGIYKILVLGLGCGTIISLLQNKFPNAKITGVEIDSVMVEIGKKYFNLKDVDIKITDARKFVQASKQKFDLILIDLYKGDVPTEKIDYLKCLSKNGIVLINHLVNLENTIEVVELQD